MGQPSFFCVKSMTSSKSWLRVGKLRSIGSESDETDRAFLVVVSPCSRASKESTPAVGSAFRTSEAKCANDRPEDPAPWWVTKRGPFAMDGLMYT